MVSADVVDAGMFLSYSPLRALLLAFITLLFFTVDKKKPPSLCDVRVRHFFLNIYIVCQ